MKKNKKEDSNKITVWAWDPNFNVAIMEEAKQRYIKLYPNVKIDIVDFGKEDLEQKLQTNLVSGLTDGLPDIVLSEDYGAKKLIQSYPGSFENLKDKINYNNFAKYKVESISDGDGIYGIPFDSGVSGLFYRRDYLKEAGFSPKDLENITWDKYIEIGKKVKQITGKEMLAIDFNNMDMIRMMIQSAGEWFFKPDGSFDISDNKALFEALTVFKKLYDAGIVKMVSDWSEWVAAFNTGDTASVISGVWLIGSIKSEDSQSGLWGVAPIPKLTLNNAKNASNIGGSSWFILSSSKNKDVAIDFMKKTFCSDKDFYENILIDRGAVGTYLPSHSSKAYTTKDDFFDKQAIFTDFSKWMKNIPNVNYGLYTPEANKVITDIVPEVLKGKNIKELLIQAEEQLKAQTQY